MHEADLLAGIFRRSAPGGGRGRGWESVRVGPGDDCAVLAPVQGELLLTVDQLIEDRHFFGPLRAGGAPGTPGTGADLAARKGVCRSVSDIAAMAGVPRWSLGTVALPADFPQEVAEELCAGVARHAEEQGCPMVGGDIAAAPGPVVVTVTVGGTPGTPRGAVTRSGARVGDAVWVTGRVGGALASGRHLTFTPRVPEGLWLAHTLGERLHAMIDVSDGLGIDSGRVALASGVALHLDSRLLPLHNGVIDWRAALADGDDYELLFCADEAAPLPERCPSTGTRFTRIGVVAPGRGALVRDDKGQDVDATQMGWEHGQASIHRSRDAARR